MCFLCTRYDYSQADLITTYTVNVTKPTKATINVALARGIIIIANTIINYLTDNSAVPSCGFIAFVELSLLTTYNLSIIISLLTDYLGVNLLISQQLNLIH